MTNSIYKLGWKSEFYKVVEKVTHHRDNMCIFGGQDGDYVLFNKYVLKKINDVLYYKGETVCMVASESFPTSYPFLYHPYRVYPVYILFWKDGFIRNLVYE